MSKNIITCPNCLMNGIKQNLAEILPSGYVAIARQSHKHEGDDYTVVKGNFSLICGGCATEVYTRKEYETDLSEVFKLSIIKLVMGSISPNGSHI